MEKLCRVLSDIKNAGHDIILISSGAVGMGMGKLSLKERPKELSMKQAAAAVGQCELMYTYDKLFGEYNHTVAQILVTAEDVKDSQRRENFINTVNRLLELGALPVINENDSVATAELGISIGENDTLAAIVAECVGADMLILLSDIDGLYTADPSKDKNATLIPVVEEITSEIASFANDSATDVGTGGMITKIKAANIAVNAGCDMIIANGEDPYILYDIIEGKNVGTKFLKRK